MIITALRSRALDVPMTKAFGIAGGAQESVRNVLVEIELGSGVRGWGEAAPLPAFNGETQEDALAAIDRAAPQLIGKSVEEWRDLADEIAELTAPVACAKCAIETAVVDALTRSRGQSMRAFFGGAEHELRTDITITTGSVADADREARTFAAFATLKIKVGGHDVETDIARVRAVHAARPDATILLDANGGLSVDDACRLAGCGAPIALFEQPVAPGSLDALAEVRRRTGLPIALDESITRPEDVASAHAKGACDAVNIKIMKSGIARALDIAEIARGLGLRIMIGGMVETRLAMATSACLAAGVGGFSFIDLDTPLFLARDPFEGGYAMTGDRIDLRPITAGHGCVPATSALLFPAP